MTFDKIYELFRARRARQLKSLDDKILKGFQEGGAYRGYVDRKIVLLRRIEVEARRLWLSLLN